MADTNSMPIDWDTNIIYKQVDILISKNQVLWILYHVYNHYLQCHNTIINSIKYKRIINNSIASRKVNIICSFETFHRIEPF